MDGEFDGIIGKKVFIILKNNRQYTGFVISTSNNRLKIIDKFNELVFIDFEQISSLEVEKDE